MQRQIFHPFNLAVQMIVIKSL